MKKAWPYQKDDCGGEGRTGGLTVSLEWKHRTKASGQGFLKDVTHQFMDKVPRVYKEKILCHIKTSQKLPCCKVMHHRED